MTRHVLLNNIDHRDLRIDTGRGAALGDDVMFAPTYPGEFRNLQAHYPIVFRRVADGGFQPLALFGLQEGGNLFLEGGHWDAGYIPLAIQRQPFLIGVSGEERLIHVDLDHPRVRRDAGQTLFRDHGGTTEFLEQVKSVLLALHDGLQATPAFIDALQRHQLLESFVLDVQLDDGSHNRLAGFHTIDEERLQALEGAALERLARDGHLLPIYMALASLSHFRDLIERMNRRRAAGR
ncbi:SapC family protein [Flavobacterium sp. MXW15]|uniref:SapC family protein n=1 Tax=Xanthomonas chitinilytica TaxID=2989819 RepID=A0ABT3JYS8_9XANT|nr:SapC family protein [Xanthomonas sp. H13-6]MCW4456059.1 SapC family protein [Flavobacterium sp. MXW15]MCW4473655.1 SapC family protein [Xanthomonas sp. H13-6]